MSKYTNISVSDRYIDRLDSISWLNGDIHSPFPYKFYRGIPIIYKDGEGAN